MASIAQTIAPRTAQHAFRAQTFVLPSEDAAEFSALINELRAHFDPQDLTEERFVREMGNAEWRLCRIRRYVDALFSRTYAEIAAAKPGASPEEIEFEVMEKVHQRGSTLHQCQRYESQFQRQYNAAYREWCTYRKQIGQMQKQQLSLNLKAALATPDELREIVEPKTLNAIVTGIRTDEPNSPLHRNVGVGQTLPDRVKVA